MDKPDVCYMIVLTRSLWVRSLMQKCVLRQLWRLYDFCCVRRCAQSRPGFPVQVSARNEMDGRVPFLGRVSSHVPEWDACTNPALRQQGSREKTTRIERKDDCQLTQKTRTCQLCTHNNLDKFMSVTLFSLIRWLFIFDHVKCQQIRCSNRPVLAVSCGRRDFRLWEAAYPIKSCARGQNLRRCKFLACYVCLYGFRCKTQRMEPLR